MGEVSGSHVSPDTKHKLAGAALVIWTTTPWTIPGNRAISYSPKIEYGLYEVVDAPAGNWAKPGERFVLADKLAAEVFQQARVTAHNRLGDVPAADLAAMVGDHPLKTFNAGYHFAVPLLAGDHVTDDAGTGFVHTAPGHGREDFEVWTGNAAKLAARGINTTIPYTVDADGRFTDHAPGFIGKRVLTDKGDKGDANEAVIKALVDAGMLLARGRLKHQYPHSWRSKKPVIFRNTPQWFIAMDKPIEGPDGKAKPGDTLRHRAFEAIEVTRWVPQQGQNRITGMVESKPDWVISRQRAWGVPITVFVREKDDGSVEILNDARVNKRIADAFEQEGADAWYATGAAARFLKPDYDSNEWQKVDDILDVWFDSGSTHAFVLEDPVHFPSLAGIRRKRDGGADTVMYLEGSDQHRGWFQSSLLESCGTRGRAPFDVVLTHGFVLDEDGRKMSKSLGNVTAPQDVIKQSGADILRMWVCASDYADDLRIGPEILKTTVDTYRKLRNTIRWMLGSLAHFREEDRIAPADDAGARTAHAAPAHRARPAGATSLCRFRLQAHLRRPQRLHDHRPLGVLLRHPQGRALLRSDLIDDAQGLPDRASTICFAPRSPGSRPCCRSPPRRHGSRAIRPKTAPCISNGSRSCPLPGATRRSRRNGARCATCAAWSPARSRSSGRKSASAPRSRPRPSSTCPTPTCSRRWPISTWRRSRSPRPRPWCKAMVRRLRSASMTSRRVAVEVRLAEGTKCARSWKILPSVGSDPAYPDVTPRDAQALREWDALRKAAE